MSPAPLGDTQAKQALTSAKLEVGMLRALAPLTHPYRGVPSQLLMDPPKRQLSRQADRVLHREVRSEGSDNSSAQIHISVVQYKPSSPRTKGTNASKVLSVPISHIAKAPTEHPSAHRTATPWKIEQSLLSRQKAAWQGQAAPLPLARS